jgi:dTDP-glucose 4,6-dehydratase
MKVVVTGGTGFIGSNYIYYALRRSTDQIICYDALTYAGNLATLKEVIDTPRFSFIRGDIADRDSVYSLFKSSRPDVVVNFAAESHVDRGIESPEVFLRTNVLGPQVLMDACREYGIKRYHQISTDEVYGELPLLSFLNINCL